MKRTLIILLALLTILAGCQTTGTTGTGDLYTGGTNGLLMSLVDQAPPTLIYDNEQTPFDIMVQAKNDGEFDVGWIIFSINGISPDDFKGLLDGTSDVKAVDRREKAVDRREGKKSSGTFLLYAPEDPILGKTKLGNDILPGEERLITLADDVTYTKELAGGGTLSFPFYITACYPYATLATIQLCVKNNYLTDDQTVCSPDTLKQMSVSGGPLQLIDYKQQAVGKDRLRITLTFGLKDNIGVYTPKGGVKGSKRIDPKTMARQLESELKAGNLQTCKPSSLNEDLREKGYFYVYVDASDIDGATLRCSGLKEDPAAAEGADMILKTEQVNFASGKSINILIEIIDDNKKEGVEEGLVRLNADGKATLTCTLSLKNANTATDSIRPIRITTAYYARQDIAGEIQVTHSES